MLSDQQQLTFRMHLPASHAVYDDLILSVNDLPLAVASEKTEAVGTTQLQPHETAALRIAYRSHGWTTGVTALATKLRK